MHCDLNSIMKLKMGMIFIYFSLVILNVLVIKCVIGFGRFVRIFENQWEY
jgi:hypothetical protein